MFGEDVARPDLIRFASPSSTSAEVFGSRKLSDLVIGQIGRLLPYRLPRRGIEEVRELFGIGKSYFPA